MSKVKLVWATPYGDRAIALCARALNPNNQDNEDISKLLTYCVKHKLWSIFERASACFEIETTRDIARQMLGNRSFSLQEFGQRYADPTVDLGTVIREARIQDSTNRQNSLLAYQWEMKQAEAIYTATAAYEWAIDNGIAREQARLVLPEGNTVSRIYMSGTLSEWMHYVTMRSGVETQKEHREVATQIGAICNDLFPISWGAINAREYATRPMN